MEGRRDIFLRKIEAGVKKEAVFGPLALDLETQSVINLQTQETLHITAQEFQILHALMRGSDVVFNSAELRDYLYENHPDHKDLPISNGLSVTMGNLRSKLGIISGGTVSITKSENRKRGYQLILESGKKEA